MKAVDVYKMAGELMEQVGDNKVDQMMDAISRSVEVELNMFIVNLLNSSVSEFEKSYVNPNFEGFRDAILDIEQRYRVMDGMERQDLFHQIEGVFKSIFLKSFSALGPETAELVAIRYAGQMIKKIKESFDNPMDPIRDLYPQNQELYPKASPEANPVHSNVPAYENPY